MMFNYLFLINVKIILFYFCLYLEIERSKKFTLNIDMSLANQCLSVLIKGSIYFFILKFLLDYIKYLSESILIIFSIS